MRTFPQMKRRRPVSGNKGFALIAVLTLMMLLALISVALMSLSVSISRVSERGLLTDEARAQARLALEIALGQLQAELGPDQRITASSGILSDESDDDSSSGVGSPYILGVWDSWDNWLNRANSKGRKIGETYVKGRQSQFRRWLISSADERTVRNWNAVTGTNGLGKGSVTDRAKVILLGKGTLGDLNEDDSIYGDLVEVTSETDHSPGMKSKIQKQKFRKGHIAWWVSGENLKARVNLRKKDSSKESQIDLLRHSWDTPAPDPRVIPDMQSLADALEEAGKDQEGKSDSILTWGTLSLAGNKSQRAGNAPYYHTATLSSSGLLADVRWGGLKKDLNMMLSSGGFEKSDFYEQSGKDAGIRPYAMTDANGAVGNSERPFASWKQLYYWYNLWKGETYNGQDQTAPLIWKGKSPLTYVAADPGAGVMNNRYTYLRQPVLLKQYVFLAFVLIYHDTYVPFDGLDCQMGARPVFVWWNPYNVPMEIGTVTSPMGGFGAPYRVLPIQQSFKCETDRTDDTGNKRRFNFPWLRYSEGVFSVYAGGLTDQGNSFSKSFNEKKIVLAPGEIKVFAQDMSYDKANNSNKVFNRSFDKVANANHYVHRFEGHEVTYEQKNQYAPNNTVPVLFKYTTQLDKPSEDPTTGAFICLHWMWRTDIVQTFLDIRMPEGVSGLLRPQHGDLSIYQIFLKEEESDERLNFAIGAGLMKDDSAALSLNDLEEGKAIEKYFPSFFNINWIDEKPYGFILGDEKLKIVEPLFNVMWDGDGMPARKGGTWGEPNNDGNPFWISYYGISPKTVNGPADHNASYKGEDARNKTWQHSSPIFWGSQLPNPTELLRKHHPYQFEIKQRQKNDYTQLDIISGDIVGQIVSNAAYGSGDEDGNAYFGYRDEDMVSHIVATELPVHPPFSLAGFASARLTPGWYDEGKVMGKGELSAKRARRISYQSGVPGIGIGNSFADPMIPADKVHFNYNMHAPELADFWDHAFMNNDALWDTWFTSSISDRPSAFGSSRVGLQEVVRNMVEDHFSDKNDDSLKLSNTRYRLSPGLESRQTITRELTEGENAWEKSARYLTVDGAFNVNSTSVDAWTAVLNGLKDRGILYANAITGEPHILEDSLKGTEVYFKRFAMASSNKSRYEEPMLRIPGDKDTYYWSDLRKFTAATSPRDSSQIHELARQIVKQVKKRGPFLNMSEFVNRRLSGNDQDLSNKGALQAAIDDAGLNEAFNVDSMRLDAFQGYSNPQASAGSVQTASPGYLVQSDILSVLGNTLTVRDDTFTIRAYGQVTDNSGRKILGRAWCEAVVQRCVEYVDPADEAEKPVQRINNETGDMEATNLSTANKAFGRKMKVLSFRWLSPDEI